MAGLPYNLRIDARGHARAVMMVDADPEGGWNWWWYDLDGVEIDSGWTDVEPRWIVGLRIDARGHVVNVLMSGEYPAAWRDLEGDPVDYLYTWHALSNLRIDARGHVKEVQMSGEPPYWITLAGEAA